MCSCVPCEMPKEAGRYRVQFHSSGLGEILFDPTATAPILRAVVDRRWNGRFKKHIVWNNLRWNWRENVHTGCYDFVLKIICKLP